MYCRFYDDTGAGGNITSIDITKCESPPCSFYTGDDLTLQFEYVTGEFA